MTETDETEIECLWWWIYPKIWVEEFSGIDLDRQTTNAKDIKINLLSCSIFISSARQPERSSTKVASWRCSWPILKRATTWLWRNWAARSHARWSVGPSILIWRSSTISPCREGDHSSPLAATVLFHEFSFRTLLIFNRDTFLCKAPVVFTRHDNHERQMSFINHNENWKRSIGLSEEFTTHRFYLHHSSLLFQVLKFIIFISPSALILFSLLSFFFIIEFQLGAKPKFKLARLGFWLTIDYSASRVYFSRFAMIGINRNWIRPRN